MLLAHSHVSKGSLKEQYKARDILVSSKKPLNL